MRKVNAIILSFSFSLLLLFTMGINSAFATGVYDLPVINAGEDIWIVDNAEAISKTTESTLDNELEDLALTTGNEVRIVVINRLDYGETIDTFTDELFSQWYPTPQEQQNQTLFVLDTLTNRTALRTQVTSLLTPEITDSVLKETVTVPLKNLQYNQALIDMSDRVVAVLSGQEDPGPPQVKEINIEGTFATAEETDDRNATIWMVVLLGLATLIPMVTYFWYVGFPGN
ncbi:photosystem II repair protein Psb32 [Geminocystis sp. CENA526]|uniref:photosystem II repair protein Psb32 n=1 Tax=Geminocystis sp. CENA526 TaxID=1355871 RepID=UPI003D6DB343